MTFDMKRSRLFSSGSSRVCDRLAASVVRGVSNAVVSVVDLSPDTTHRDIWPTFQLTSLTPCLPVVRLAKT